MTSIVKNNSKLNKKELKSNKQKHRDKSTFLGLNFYKNLKQVPVTSGVYCIRNKSNNKLYIGSTINMSGGGIKARLRNHIRQLNKGCHNNIDLQEDWNKYDRSHFLIYCKACLMNETRDTEEQLIRQQTIKTLYNKSLSVSKNYRFMGETHKIIVNKSHSNYTLYWQGYKVDTYSHMSKAKNDARILGALNFKDTFKFISSKSTFKGNYLIEQSPDDNLFNLFISGLFLGTYINYEDAVEQAEKLKSYYYKKLVRWKEINITPINIKVEPIPIQSSHKV